MQFLNQSQCTIYSYVKINSSLKANQNNHTLRQKEINNFLSYFFKLIRDQILQKVQYQIMQKEYMGSQASNENISVNSNNGLTQHLQKQIANGKQHKLAILVISEVHRNRIDNQLSVDIANQAINCLRALDKDKFVFYSDYQTEFPNTLPYCPTFPKIDFILTVGTNHTLMYTFYRFENVSTPPILALSSEGESTLFNYTKCDIQWALKTFVQKLQSNQLSNSIESFPKIQMLHNQIVKNSTCQIEICRACNPALVKMQLYCRNIKNDNNKEVYIGKLWGDGLVISTGFGSVSRSMVLNGPIIHNKIQCIILTPVCPLSLKFRPIVLPIECELIIKIDQHSRAEGTVFVDGINIKRPIKPGEKIIISKSPFKTNMVTNLNGSYEQTLFQNLQQFLSWGEQFSSKDYKNSQQCKKQCEHKDNNQSKL